MSMETNSINIIKIEIRLLELIITEKVFLKKDLSLGELARTLDTNMNYLSVILNKRLRTNFNDFINTYRIKEACSIIKENSQQKTPVAEIAAMTGFSSRSTFYSTFRKYTGMTPIEYQKEMKKNVRNNVIQDSGYMQENI